jgi:hypothetical protein
MDKTYSMNAVAFQQGDVWVVQGIQYNLVAVARNVQDVPKAFMNAVIERVHVAEHLGLDDPFLGVGPAPERFHKMFDAASTEVKPALSAGRPMPSVRLASAEVMAA